MKIENPKLDKINQELQILERHYDREEIKFYDYDKAHKFLIKQKSLILDKIIGDKNE